MARRRRSRHSTRRPRRGWWYAGTVALTVAGVLIAYGAWSPSGSDGARTQDREAAALPSAPRPAPPASPSGTASPSASPSASGSAEPEPSATRTRKQEPDKEQREPTAEPGDPSVAQPSTAPAGRRLITVVNETQKTIWAVVTNTPVYPEGRKLTPGQSMSVTVENDWGGRIWGRTGCASTAAGKCATGHCTSVCGGYNPPTTLGEFTFDAYAGMDFYDVSMVDGSNLPMYINVSHTTTVDPVSSSGCYQGVCTSEVDCPTEMQAVSGGQVIGCKPPCEAFGGNTYCCLAEWAGRENCIPSKWPVDYTQVFKRAAPYAYSYAFDDSATMSCKGACYYRVTFGTTGT